MEPVLDKNISGFYFRGKKIGLNSRWSKILSVFMLVGILFSFVYIYVRAQSVTDTFSTTDNVAATWQTQVATTTSEAKLALKECDNSTWLCSASTTCANLMGDGDYIIVAQTDAPTTKQWKTTNTACAQPYCENTASQTYKDLVADNTVSFSAYPARDYCKSIGGRMPSLSELSCIYTNRASLGANFGAGDYWSSTEYSGLNSRYVIFSNGNINSSIKTSANSVRCVKGW